MARFATYTAPIDRIHPNDLGYTANVQLGRRLAGFASERAGTIRSDAAAQAAALRQGGALESQNILTSRRADVALQRFIDEGLNPVQAAQTRGGGGGGGGSLGRDRDTASPREVARGAPALISALAQSAGDTGFNDSTKQRYFENKSVYREPSVGMQGPYYNPTHQEFYDPPPPANSIREYKAPDGTMKPDVYVEGDRTSIFAPEYLGLSGVPATPASSNVFMRWFNAATGAVGGALSAVGDAYTAASPVPSEGVDPDYTSGGF